MPRPLDGARQHTLMTGASPGLSAGADPFSSLGLLGRASRFEALLLDITIARAALDWIRTSRVGAIPDALDPSVLHRDRILFAFEQLSRIPSLPSPKLVYVHILSPHPPMVFGQENSPPGQAGFESEFAGNPTELGLLLAYARQVDYLNGKIIESVQSILDGSDQEPIIILTGDHGSADRPPEDKLSILHAYYLPGGGETALYPTITPVNSFRLIFDRYLGGEFGLLEDASYYSTLDSVFQFQEVENTWLDR